MASPLQIAAGGWGFVVMGWMLSPILSLLVNKFFTNLSLDTSRKLRKLEIDTIPSLKETLREVEEQRMVGAVNGKGSESNLVTLMKIENDLKSVLYEAEDILDLVDYHRIEKKVKGDGPSWISRAVGACITRCKGTWLFRRCIEGIRPALCQCAKGFCWLAATLCRSGEQIPISQEPSNSNPVVQRLRAWSQSLDIKALCQSMQKWLAETYVAACHYRDWSYEVVGINKTNKEDDIAVDLFFLTIDGKSLWKRIEDIENIFNDLKSLLSSLNELNQDSSSSSKIVAEDTNKEETDDMHRSIKWEVFGRDKEREHICSMLRKGSDADEPTSSSSKPYSVFVIHGIRGSGKTTLAKYVCDLEKKAKDKHFDPVMFIHVSETFRIDKIFRDMLSEMGQQSGSNGLTALRDELKENLKGKRFLLVLDDLWVNNENRKGRDILLDALDAGQSGSIILVTAQREDAAAALGAQKQILIPDLEENDYLSLFMHHARPGTIEDDGEYKRIGTKIANKLHRSPIAAVTVGEQLLNRSISFWETTANDVVLNETMGALWWSYQQLGADIRRCFAYCSTFPRGYKLERDELVRIWIAQGFVNTGGNATEEMEDVGNRYFDELLEFSFLQVQGRTFNGTEVITIHDLLHELAETVAGSDFLRIDLNGSPKDIPAGVRHVFIETNNGAKVLAEKNQDLGKLRTLIIKERCTEDMDRTQPKDEDFKEVFDCLFKRLRELRVLIIELQQKPKVLSVPASVDRMKHLRYLGFRVSSFSYTILILPSTFSKLYHMQTLDARDMSIFCPEDMANLLRWRHVIGSLDFRNVLPKSFNEWVLDMGGEFHCTWDWRLLQDTKIKPSKELTLPDGSPVPMHDCGLVRTEQLMIPDVHYAPRLLTMNIVSLYKLRHDHGLAAVFRQNRCDVMDDKSGLIVGSARLRDGRYVLDYLLVGKEVDASLLDKISKGGLSELEESFQAPKATKRTIGDSSEIEQTDGVEWVLDSRTKTHRTSNKQLLLDGGVFEPAAMGASVKFDVFSSSGCWSIRTERFKVQRILYNDNNFGEQTSIIISVAQLARDHGFVAIFEPTYCRVRDPRTEKDIGEGRLRDSKYVLDYLLIGQAQGAVDAAWQPPGTNAQELEGRPSFGFPPCHSAVDQHDEIGLLPWDVMRRKHDEELHSFIMDSVALHHMSRNREILKDYHADLHINPPIKSVTSPSDSCLPVRGIGYIDSKGGSLDRVLFVPNSDVNLVSVSQLTKDYSVRVVFSKFWFVIEKLESRERIGHGKCMDQSYVVVHLDVGAASDWILDSFAWLHHTPNRQILYYLQKKADDFSMPTGRDQLQILGHGSVQTERFKVPGVRYTEEDTRNVISVAQLAKNHRLVTIFEPTCCKVKDIKTGKIIGKGHLRNGMYVLDYLRISQDIQGGNEGGNKGKGQHEGGSGKAGSGDRGGSGGMGHEEGSGDKRGSVGGGHEGGGGCEGGARGCGRDIGDNGGGREGGRGGSIGLEQEGSETRGHGEGGRDGRIGGRNRGHESGGDAGGCEGGKGSGRGREGGDKAGHEGGGGRGGGGQGGGGGRGYGGGGEGGGTNERGGSGAGDHGRGGRDGEGGGNGVRGNKEIDEEDKKETDDNDDKEDKEEKDDDDDDDDDDDEQAQVQMSGLSQFCRYITTALRNLIHPRFHGGANGGGGRKEHKIRGGYLEEPSQAHERLFALTRSMIRDQSGNLYGRLRTEAFLASPNEERERRKEFLVDSGASFHMMWNGEDLIHYGDDLRNCTEPPIKSFGGIGSESIEVIRSGYFESDKILLHGILLADKARVNLVSVGQLSLQYNVDVVMNDKVIITNRSDGAQIGGGEMNGHHYVLESFRPPRGGPYGPLLRCSNNMFGKFIGPPPKRI